MRRLGQLTIKRKHKRTRKVVQFARSRQGLLVGLVLACACVRMARLQCSEAGSSSEFKFKCVGCRLAKGVGVGTKQHAH